MTAITDKQIREYIHSNPDHKKVVIKRNGEIHVRTNRQRGDGGSTPWWMFAGHRSEIAAEILPIEEMKKLILDQSANA